MKLSELTSDQVSEYLRTSRTIVVPMGSTEQHGELAPTGCDTLVCEALCVEAASRSGTIAAPVLSIGSSECHMRFPGTISLKAMTLASVVRDVAETLYSSGFRRIFLLSGHGGNRGPALTGLVDASSICEDAYMRYLGYWDLPGAQQKIEQLFGDRNGDHATAAEVSITMHLRPDFEPHTDGRIPQDGPMTGEVISAKRWKQAYPEGPCGVDFEVVSAEKGRELLDFLSTALADMLGREE